MDNFTAKDYFFGLVFIIVFFLFTARFGTLIAIILAFAIAFVAASVFDFFTELKTETTTSSHPSPQTNSNKSKDASLDIEKIQEENIAPNHSHTEDSKHTQSVSQPSPLELFDAAIAHSDEDEAIVFGGALLQAGEMLHVMLGFKKLAKKGFERSEELYATLLYRLSIAQRRSQSFHVWKMTLNELVDAMDIIGTAGSEHTQENLFNLKRELMCWNAVAHRNSQEGETAIKCYHNTALEILAELVAYYPNDSDVLECITFVNEWGIVL